MQCCSQGEGKASAFGFVLHTLHVGLFFCRDSFKIALSLCYAWRTFSFFSLLQTPNLFISLKKKEERNLSSLSLTSSSSIKSGPRLHHLLHLFHQHLKSCSQYLLFLQRLVKSMNGEVVKVARLLCFSLSSNFFSMALPLLMSFFSSSFFSLPSYSKDQLSSIPVKVFWFELGTGLSCQIFTYNCVEWSRAGKFNFLLFAAHSITVIFSLMVAHDFSRGQGWFISQSNQIVFISTRALRVGCCFSLCVIMFN